MANYSSKKFSSTILHLTTIHPLRTDGQTGRRTTTMPKARPLLNIYVKNLPVYNCV